jgi:hypothetical protein
MPLVSFLHDVEPASLAVPGGEANACLQSLFGRRIEAETAIRLLIDRGANWAISSADKSGKRLYILDIPLEFGHLKLRRIKPELNAAVGGAAAPAGASAATSAGASAATAPGAAAPVTPTPATVEPAAPAPNDAGPASATELSFDEEAVNGLLPGQRRPAPDGLYGAVEDILGFTRPAKNPADRMLASFDLAARAAQGQTVAVGLELTNPGSLRVKMRAALQHWGDPARTVAGCFYDGSHGRSIGRLRLRSQGGSPGDGREDGPFEIAGFGFTRQLIPNGKGRPPRILWRRHRARRDRGFPRRRRPGTKSFARPDRHLGRRVPRRIVTCRRQSSRLEGGDR